MTTWKRFAYVETGGNADVMTISSIPATAKYLRLIIDIRRNGTMDNVSLRFNDDDNSNRYAWVRDSNGDDESSQANYNYLRFWYQGGSDGFAVIDIVNLVNKEKLCMSHMIGSEGATPSGEVKNTTMVGKWTENPVINKITIHEFAGGATFGDGTSATLLIPDEGALVYTYPNLSNGALFEESDTGKIYMFDGTSAWNEMT